jgi:hypothetical protein
MIKNKYNFDLIISCLEGHHYELDSLMQSYMNNLKSDGAILGCSWA